MYLFVCFCIGFYDCKLNWHSVREFCARSWTISALVNLVEVKILAALSAFSLAPRAIISLVYSASGAHAGFRTLLFIASTYDRRFPFHRALLIKCFVWETIKLLWLFYNLFFLANFSDFVLCSRVTFSPIFTNVPLKRTMPYNKKRTDLGLAVLTSLSLDQYSKTSVGYFPVLLSLSVSKLLVLNNLFWFYGM